MKRKLFLLILAVAMLVCVFSISVSAEDIVVNTITSETYGTVYQLSADPGLDEAHKYVSTLNTIEDKGSDTEALAILTDGTYYYVFPSSYIVEEILTGGEKGKFSLLLTTGAGGSTSQKGVNVVFAEWNEAEGQSLPTFAMTAKYGSTTIDSLVRFVIPSDVTYFDANHCMFRSATLVEVRIPRSVRIKSGSLFSGCLQLTTVQGFELVTNINGATSTFINCTSLVSVKFPSDTTVIGKETFQNCTSFTGISNWDELKNNITSIGQDAFNNCDALVSIELPALTSIGTKAFAYCDALTTVDLTGSSFVKLNSAFRNCPKLDGIVLPDTVDGISQDGFHGCSSLTSIVIPRDSTYIGNYAFNGCSSLAVIDMSKAVNLKSSGNSSFGGVIVEELHFPEGFETFGGISTYTLKVLTFPDSTTSLGVIKGSITEFRVPLGVTSLGNKTFDFCSSLETVTIHGGVTSIVTGKNNPTFFGTSLSKLTTIYYTGTEDDELAALLAVAAPNATIVYADHCETYLGGHSWLGVNEVVLDNYFTDIEVADSCAECKKNQAKQIISPLFVSKGISAKTYGDDIGLVQGYEINKAAIEAYKAYVPDFNFGILAYANVTGGAVAPKPGDDKVVDIVFDKTANSYLEVKVTGIPADFLDAPIVFCIYATEGDKLYYLDNGNTTETIVGSSYNNVVNN